MSASEEMVLVVPRSLFDELGAFQGISFEVEKYLSAFLAREKNFFMPRSRAENDPAFKQIIPYALLVHDGRVLHYVRGKKSGEQRLVAKGSIGIGGHMNQDDESLFVHSLDRGAYLEAVRREISEEVRIRSEFTNNI